MTITLKEWLVDSNGYASAQEALEEYSEMDDSYPAICSEDCQAEPDGHYPHGPLPYSLKNGTKLWVITEADRSAHAVENLRVMRG